MKGKRGEVWIAYTSAGQGEVLLLDLHPTEKPPLWIGQMGGQQVFVEPRLLHRKVGTRKRVPKATAKLPPKKKPKKRAKKAPKKKLPTSSPPKRTARVDISKKLGTANKKGQCLDSPCVPEGRPDWFMDPKLGVDMVRSAMEKVGQPKLKRAVSVNRKTDQVLYKPTRTPHLPGDGAWPLTVACGLGVDSTAILVGLAQLARMPASQGGGRKWIPRAITFADTGGENPETYKFAARLNRWLKSVGFPQLTVTAHATENIGRGSWGTGVTLEASCINNHTLPAIAYHGGASGGGGHACSLKYKIQPQEAWLEAEIAKGARGQIGQIPPKGRVIRAIGYDATEDNRLTKASTYSSADEESKGFRAWYPLLEWNWDRARCIAEIIHEFTGSTEVNNKTMAVVPQKSACFFCSAAKPLEIAALPKDLLKRAIFMEQVTIHGRHGLSSMGGLGGDWSWSDFAVGKIPKGAWSRQAVINGTVYKQLTRGPRAGQWVRDYYGAPRGKLKPNQKHVPGTGPLLTQRELDEVIASAKAWTKVTNKLKKSPDLDVACLKAADKIPAYSQLLGFRGSRVVQYDRLKQEILPSLEAKRAELRSELAGSRPGTKAHRERLLKLEGVEVMLACLPRLYGRRRNPPEPPSPVPFNVLLFGGTQIHSNPYAGDRYFATPFADLSSGPVELLEQTPGGWRVRGEQGEFEVDRYQLRRRLPPGSQLTRSGPVVPPEPAASADPEGWIKDWVAIYSQGVPQERLQAGYVLRNDDYLVMPAWSPKQQGLQQAWFGQGDPSALRWTAFVNRGGQLGRPALEHATTGQLVSWLKRKKVKDYRRNPESWEQFFATIPVRWKAWADSLPPKQRSSVLGRWYHWWVQVGRGESSPQRHLFEGGGPWEGDPPPLGRMPNHPEFLFLDDLVLFGAGARILGR